MHVHVYASLVDRIPELMEKKTRGIRINTCTYCISVACDYDSIDETVQSLL